MMNDRDRNDHYRAASVLSAAAGICRSGWAKESEARTEDGAPVVRLDPRATCFCASSAILQAVDELCDAERRAKTAKTIAMQAMVKAIRVRWPNADLRGEMWPDAFDPEDYPGRRHSVPFEIIVNWNDKPERTQDEVVAALDRGAGMLYERVSAAAAEAMGIS